MGTDDIKKMAEEMMKAAMEQMESQIAQEREWLAGLESDPSQLSFFERGVTIANYKGESARQRYLATMAKSDEVRDAIVKQAEWCDEIVARLEKLPIDGTEPVTLN